MTPDQLADLHRACFTMPRPWTAGEFTALMAGTGVFITAPTPTAFAMGRAILDEVELLTLAVDPSARRTGLGAATLNAFELEALRRGALRAHLEVAANNAAARALYQTAGYCESGQRRGYYDAPNGAKIDAIILTKPLKRA